jgi:1-acyl-sn-glycerol-3-phosphate acyltransferase
VNDVPYRLIVGAARAWFKAMDFRFVVTGQENVPRTGGAVLAINHVSYVDFIMAGYGAVDAKRLVRFMAKKEAFDHPVSGPLMRSMHHISVDRSDGQGSYDDAVRYLRDGEVVGVFPEATISRSFLVKELKTGAVRMAADADVPLIPLVLWGTQRLITKDHPRDLSRHKTISVTVGRPMDPHGNAVERTKELHAVMSSMLDTAIRSYPAEEQPAGSWWLPTSYGGSAPTPEQAKLLDAEELRRRAASRVSAECSGFHRNACSWPFGARKSLPAGAILWRIISSRE